MIELKNISKKYDDIVLDRLSYTFEEGKIYVIKGISGCGKTTLLNILGLLEPQYDGEYFFEGTNVDKLNRHQREETKQLFGYVFQSSLLLSKLSVLDNLRYIKDDEITIRKYAKQLNVEGLLEKYPEELSGGERQRFSIIRTLLMNPSVILADEPTASLDKVNSAEIASLFNSLRKDDRIIIVATHENYFDELADEIINLRYGVVESVKINDLQQQTKDESDDGQIAEKTYGNAISVMLPFIFKRYKDKLKLSALAPLIVVITAILICFSVHNNFYDQAVRRSKEQYPIEVISMSDFFYDEVLSYRGYDVEKYDLYIIEMEEYSVYPLLKEENSVLGYGGLVKFGTFPSKDNEVLINYDMALYLSGDNRDGIEENINNKIRIQDEDYIITGIVADLENDNEIDKDIYYGDCYYGEAEQSRLVYMPYEVISKQGELVECSEYMVKVNGLYENDEIYNDIKYTILGGYLSDWDVKLEDMQIMVGFINKIIAVAFIVSALMAMVFIRNDIKVDLFYRRKELGYLQIFGVKKRTIAVQIVLERMVKSLLALLLSVLVFNVVSVILKLLADINCFIPAVHILLLLLIILGFNFISVIGPVLKFMKKSVLSLITE